MPFLIVLLYNNFALSIQWRIKNLYQQWCNIVNFTFMLFSYAVYEDDDNLYANNPYL